MGKKLVIFGTGDMGKIARFYFDKDSDYEVLAFTTDKAYITEDSFDGLPLLAFEDIEKHYNPKDVSMYIAIGYSQMNKLRASKYFAAKEKGYSMATYISSKATVWTDDIGDNTFILEDNTLQPFVSIGSNVILWSGNHVGHDVVVEDHCFITSHVVLSGRVKVGAYSFIGVNSTVRDQVLIAPETFIAAGALIVANTVEKGVYKQDSKAVLSKVSSDQLRGN
jgi:sugar O-acyltransferase (sialic acid O-acetyltransferase NeuD family)